MGTADDSADVCPCCGAVAVQAGDPITAACDVLVVRALEQVGKRIVKFERTRYTRMDGRPWHEAHLEWQPDDGMVNAVLAVAWDSVPVLLDDHGCCGLTPETLTAVLDRYVRDLLVTQQGHSVTELRYRLGAYLGIPSRDVPAVR